MRRIALALLVVGVISGCADSDSRPTATQSPSVSATAPTGESAPSPSPATSPGSQAPPAAPDVVLAARALARDAAAFNDGFTAWVTGGSGEEAAELATSAADSARALSAAANADASVLGATGLASSADDYAAFFDRSAVLTRQGETAYKASEAVAGDVDCFKERAHDLWLTAAARYLGNEYAEPPVSREGLCDAGFGT